MTKAFVCFLQALTEYRAELRDDPIINTHLAKLYDNLLEQNLIRVIEPFSRVQVSTAFKPLHVFHVRQRRLCSFLFTLRNPTFLRVISYLLFNATYNLTVLTLSHHLHNLYVQTEHDDHFICLSLFSDRTHIRSYQTVKGKRLCRSPFSSVMTQTVDELFTRLSSAGRRREEIITDDSGQKVSR